jgi:hypothetical protein
LNDLPVLLLVAAGNPNYIGRRRNGATSRSNCRRDRYFVRRVYLISTLFHSGTAPKLR